MKFVGRVLWLAPILVLAVLCMAAETAHGAGRRPAWTTFDARGPASDGYHYILREFRAHSDKGGLAIGIFARRTRALTETDYSARRPGRVTPRSVRGRLGKRGRLDLRFQPTGPPEVKPDYEPCLAARIRPGILRGTIRFRGERGYVRVRDRRVAAERIANFPRAHCSWRRGGIDPPHKRTRAALTGCSRESVYEIRRHADRTTSAVAVSDYSLRAGLIQVSAVVRRVRPGAFEYAKDFTSATFSLPEPFSGTGEYADGAVDGDASWRAPNGVETSMSVDDAHLGQNDRSACATFTPFRSPSPAAASTARDQHTSLAGVSLPGG